MLILTRRIGETIFIGDEVRVTVLGINGSQARIGIMAPREIAVHREEVYQRLRSEDHEASMSIDKSMPLITVKPSR